MKCRYAALGLLATILTVVGCSISPPPVGAGEDDLASLPSAGDPATDPDQLAFKDAYMKTFVIEQHSGITDRAVRPLLPVPSTPGARATWPADTAVRQFSQTAGSLLNYPEPGVLTSYALAAAPAVGANVYEVTVTSTFPATSVISTYVESYYVRDQFAGGTTPDGWWSEADPIVDASGVVDPAARIAMRMNFRDGSVRYEKIVKFLVPGLGGTGYAAFDILGTLSFPEFSYPTADAQAGFSSVVVYQQTAPTQHDYSFWQGVEDQAVVGVRYYTEHTVDGGTQYKGTTVAYEKAVSSLATEGGSFMGTLQDVFLGSEHAVLAESVFRREVLYDLVDGVVNPSAVGQNSIMRSHVVDVTNQVDFQLQILNDDVTRLLAWEGPTYSMIPAPGAEGIEIADPGTAVLRKDTLTNPDGTEVSTLASGSSDLATLYRSLRTGAASLVVAPGNDVDGTIDGDGEVLSFDGNVGASYPDGEAYDLTTAGTVEAWVYINVQSNWGGIVHKGKELDFSDEAYSLQFVSNRGDVAFAIVRQGPYAYRMAQSSLRLSTRRWYHVVGTWDSSYVKIYVNGVQRGSVTNNLVPPEPSDTNGPIVIGSQLLEGETMEDWYGFSGKINAVRITAGAKSLATIQADYAAGLALTANW